MSQKLPVNGFKWVECIAEFNEFFIKSYNDESDKVMKDIFLKLMFSILKIYIIVTIFTIFA